MASSCASKLGTVYRPRLIWCWWRADCLILQDGKLRGTPVPLDRSGVSFCDIAFAAGGAVTADEAQRGYLAASSGDLVPAGSSSGLTAHASPECIGTAACLVCACVLLGTAAGFAFDKDLAHRQSSFCCAAGCVYQISCQRVVIEAVHKVHTGGTTALAVGLGVCATAGRDRRLRIWRTGFAALLLEVWWESWDAAGTAVAQNRHSCVPCGTVLGAAIVERSFTPCPRRPGCSLGPACGPAFNMTQCRCSIRSQWWRWRCLLQLNFVQCARRMAPLGSWTCSRSASTRCCAATPPASSALRCIQRGACWVPSDRACQVLCLSADLQFN